MDLLEKLHTDHRFGDSAQILSRVTLHYHGLLAWCELRLGLDGRQDALWRQLQSLQSVDRTFILRSGPIREMIEQLATSISGPGGADLKILSTLASILTEAFQLPRNAGVPYGFDAAPTITEPYPLHLIVHTKRSIESSAVAPWNEAEAVRQMFDREMANDVGARRCVIRAADSSDVGRFEEALALLGRVSTHIPTDVAAHVRHLCPIDFECWEQMLPEEYREIGQSVSSHLVPSTCFFSYHSMGRTETLTEAIYHEALHKKLSNILVADSVLSDDYNPLTSERFVSYWNQDTAWNPNAWEFDRALYAFHVYVHLVAYYKRVLAERIVEANLEWCSSRLEQAREGLHNLGASA